MSTNADPVPVKSDALIADSIREFERTLGKLEQTRPFAKGVHQLRLCSLAMKLLDSDTGIAAMYAVAPRFDAAGVFHGGDWAEPQFLDPGKVRASLDGDGMYPAVESLSELRLLALASGDAESDAVTAAEARTFLEDVLARNLDIPFPAASEVTRQTVTRNRRLTRLFAFLLDRLGTDGIVDALANECERMLLQRPIMVQRVEKMLRSAVAVFATEPTPSDGPGHQHVRWMIEALDGPTALSQAAENPGAYGDALKSQDRVVLAEEAQSFGQRMNDTGLVSPPHATLLRYLAVEHPSLLPDALALDRIGRTSFAEHQRLVVDMIGHAVLPETARCIYGLSRLLNLGILFFPPVAPGLRRLMVTEIQPAIGRLLQTASQLESPPHPNALLLAGTLSVIGQPRGVDQGHNPTCQAARAISLWSQNDVGYLLEIVSRAARDDELVMHFEGDAIRSTELSFGLAEELHTELDPVSLVLTPHLDKIYMEMSRRTIGRDEDGHKWVNPEFHGWWVYRGFASLVDAETEGIKDFDGFVRTFHAAYHPDYNGARDLVYAQPCGVVSTTADGEFVGWHAVSIQRIAVDPSGLWRVYFFNPNHDKGQNWGQGIVTSTCDAGELEGESSLPFEQFLMRLYVFHYQRSELGDPARVPIDMIDEIRNAIVESWARDRAWLGASEAGHDE